MSRTSQKRARILVLTGSAVGGTIEPSAIASTGRPLPFFRLATSQVDAVPAVAVSRLDVVIVRPTVGIGVGGGAGGSARGGRNCFGRNDD